MSQPFGSITAHWLDTVGPVGGHEPIDLDLAAAETMFLGLRLLDGLNLAEASARLGVDLGARYRAQIAELLEQDLLVKDGDLLRLHASAFLIANQVFTRFLD